MQGVPRTSSVSGVRPQGAHRTRLAPLALAALGWVCLAGQARGQEAAPPVAFGPRAPAGTEAADGRAADRLLHLASGGVLRARARFVAGPRASDAAAGDGHWEVQRGGEWTALPARSVTRALLEQDVLAEARRRERALGRAPALDARVAHVAWLADQGLALEALRALDELAGEAPDHDGVRALCADPRLPLAVPPLVVGPDDRAADGGDQAALERFLAEVARGGPIVRERALRALDPAARAEARAEPRSEAWVGALLATLRADLQHPRPDRRALAAFLHRRLLPGRDLEALVRRSLLDEARAVRLEANRSLAVADDARVLGTFVRLLRSRSEAARLRSVEALADIGHGAAVAPLVATLAALSGRGGSGAQGSGVASFGTWTSFVGDFDVEVAQGQSVADPRVRSVGSGAALGVRVLGTGGGGDLAGAIRAALARLCGERSGRSSRAWLAWWDEHGADWAEAHPAPPDRGATGGGASARATSTATSTDGG